MSITVNLIVLFLSSILLNFFLIYSNITLNPIITPNATDPTIICTEKPISYVVNEWFLRFDTRFEQQQKNFTPKSYFPIIEYDNNTIKELNNLNNLYTRHVAFNYPFVVRGGVKHWKALEKWKNDTYLLEEIGDLMIYVEKKKQGNKEFAYFKKDFKKKKMKYKRFLKLSEKYENEPFIYYWAEQKLPKTLKKDIREPKFGNLFNLEEIHIWQGFAGTISLPHTDQRDNFFCQVVGTKEFIMIPPTQRNLLYVDEILDETNRPKNYSPVNFYDPDYEKHPEFANVRGKMYVKLEEGDLLYIPSFWWHHVKASKNKNMCVNFWYTANFMVSNMFWGIHSNFIDEDE